MTELAAKTLMLYDGVCGLCNRGVQFLIRRDRYDRLRFASLQSGFAEALLKRHGLSVRDADTVYAVVNHGTPDEQLLAKADAILVFAEAIGGVWKSALIGKIVPRAVRNLFYDFVARHRYRVFGKYEACLLPSMQVKHKFVEV